MAQDWQAFPSGISTGVNSYDRTVVEEPESIGDPADAAATEQNETNSMFSLGKGMLVGLGVAAGSGDAVVNTAPRVFADPVEMLGDRSDPPAPDSGAHSVISLLKGILAGAGI